MKYNVYREGCFVDPTRIRAFQANRDPFPNGFAPCVAVLGRQIEAPDRRAAIKIALEGRCRGCFLRIASCLGEEDGL